MKDIEAIEQIKERLIVEGIASVKKNETRPERIRGGIIGFELCRELQTADDFLETLEDRHRHEDEMQMAEDTDISCYWEYRYATVQIEFVWERLKVIWHVGSTQSARAVLHVHRLLREL